MRLSPSVLAADFTKLGEQLDIVASSGVNAIHYDVMDGDFVPALSFGDSILKNIKNRFGDSLFLDAHLMVTEPARFAETFRKAGADNITIHIEACKHIDRSIEAVKDTGAQVGIALNPGTPLDTISEIIHKVDLVLIMSVNPGFGGQKYISYCTDKIARLYQWKKDLGLDFSIQVDGGISPDNVRMVLDAGVDNVVAGSAVFKNDIAANCKAFRDIMKF